MLSRTAGNLFWTGRFVERADFVARLLHATLRLASLPASEAVGEGAWASALAAAGVANAYAATGAPIDEAGVVNFLAFNTANPSSIRSCLERARTNARSVRTALTSEVWETINSAWLDLCRYGAQNGGRDDLIQFLDAVKALVLTYDGAGQRSMLRGEAYWFLSLGSWLERADNTARLLDVKYHLLLPKGESVGGGVDYFQWTTILRTVSAVTAYRWVYRTSLKPWLVADLLILNRQMARSLASCYDEILRHLDLLASATGRRGASHRLAAATENQLNSARIETIFQSGLHEFLSNFIAENNRLGTAIAEQYLF